MTVLLSLKRCWKLLPLWWRKRTTAGIAAAEARLKKHTAVYADFSKGLAPGQQA